MKIASNNTRLSNKLHYDKIWKNYRISSPEMWPQWQIISRYKDGVLLEIGPGTRPRIPIKNNHFLDISKTAVMKLKALGGYALQNNLKERLPYKNSMFDLVAAFELFEHLPNDRFIIREISRVLKKNGILFFSIPLKMDDWSAYDKAVGHFRRYEISNLNRLFANTGLHIKSYAKMNIIWPKGITGDFISFLLLKFPFFVSKMGEFFDLLPFSAVRRPLVFKKWGEQAKNDFSDANSGVFIASKN
jgi:SAM-dependent methyltransferase